MGLGLVFDPKSNGDDTGTVIVGMSVHTCDGMVGGGIVGGCVECGVEMCVPKKYRQNDHQIPNGVGIRCLFYIKR